MFCGLKALAQENEMEILRNGNWTEQNRTSDNALEIYMISFQFTKLACKENEMQILRKYQSTSAVISGRWQILQIQVLQYITL